jgi:phospholipase C
MFTRLRLGGFPAIRSVGGDPVLASRSRKAAVMFSSARKSLLALIVAAAGTVIGVAPASASPGSAATGHPLPATTGHYDHVFVIVEENHGYTDVIGNKAAPNLNALASQYGVATNYFAVAHPSEPNYVALLGGSTFTVNSDNAYYVQQVHAPSLISELDQAHVSWKA